MIFYKTDHLLLELDLLREIDPAVVRQDNDLRAVVSDQRNCLEYYRH